MTRWPIKLVAIGLLPLASVASTPLVVMAQDSAVPVSDAVVFWGEAVVTTDNAGPAQDPDVPGFMDLIGGGGSFSMTSALCLGWSDVDEAGLCSITVSGSFSTQLCGTFVLDGTGTLTISGPLASEAGSTGFHGSLIDGIGVVTNTGPVRWTSDGETVGDSSLVGVLLVMDNLSSFQPSVNYINHVVLGGDTADCLESLLIVGAFAALE
jgi:hypothetical protein